MSALETTYLRRKDSRIYEEKFREKQDRVLNIVRKERKK